MNYEICWDNLLRELVQLKLSKVQSIDPEVVIRFMSYIEQVEINRSIKEEVKQ